MKNYKFGYARVSTEDQILDRQLDMLNNYGIDMIFSEKMREFRPFPHEKKEIHTDVILKYAGSNNKKPAKIT